MNLNPLLLEMFQNMNINSGDKKAFQKPQMRVVKKLENTNIWNQISILGSQKPENMIVSMTKRRARKLGYKIFR